MREFISLANRKYVTDEIVVYCVAYCEYCFKISSNMVKSEYVCAPNAECIDPSALFDIVNFTVLIDSENCTHHTTRTYGTDQ